MNKFNRTILAGLVLAADTAVQAADRPLHVSGTLRNFGDSAIVLYAAPNEAPERKAVPLKRGAFDIDIPLKQVSFIQITPAGGPERQREALTLVAVPGETLLLNAIAGEEVSFGGSTFYRQYQEAQTMLSKDVQAMQQFNEQLQKRLEAGEAREKLQKEYRERYDKMQADTRENILAFIRRHPDYEAGATLVSHLETVEQMTQAVAALSPAVREGRMKPYYTFYLSRAHERAAREERASKMQQGGMNAPDFTLNDLQGNPLALSSLRGKYVVLDFWGSWCIWCIRGIPKMKEYYEKYKGKLEILGIDCNEPAERWKAAVEKHRLPWLHVYNPTDSKVLTDYGVQGFPTKVIVDPDGKIVKTIVGEDPAFYSLLDELLGK